MAEVAENKPLQILVSSVDFVDHQDCEAALWIAEPAVA